MVQGDSIPDLQVGPCDLGENGLIIPSLQKVARTKGSWAGLEAQVFHSALVLIHGTVTVQDLTQTRTILIRTYPRETETYIPNLMEMGKEPN